MAYMFSFSSIARTIQVRLLCGADVEHLPELDRKYWLMLSCAVSAMGPEGEAVARALDIDGDGRVRVPEVLAAIAWLRPRLKTFDCLFTEAEGLSVDEVNGETVEGKPLAALLWRLSSTGMLSAKTIGEAFSAFLASAQNGDGVVASSAAGEKFAPVGEAVLAVTGGEKGADGAVGLSMATLDAFDAALKAYKAWRAALPVASLPGGGNPQAAVQAVASLQPKMEFFFRTCALLRYNPAAGEALPSPKQVSELPEAPVALPSAEARGVPFERGVNPSDAAAIDVAAAVAMALEPGATCFTEKLWRQVVEAVSPFAAWVAAKPAGADVLAGLDEQVLALADEPAVRQAFAAAIAADTAQAPLAAAFGDLQRLLTLRGGLLRFLRNFVNAEELYPPRANALFQTGTLYLDGRTCSLCFPIEQAAAAHAAAAASSNCCLAYCSVSRPAEGAKRTICAVFTAGSAASLAVGRNGLFFDLEGKDWEATLIHLAPNPMSLPEAFFAPWRKIGMAFTGAVKKFVAGKNEAATAAMVDKAEKTADGTEPVAMPTAGNGSAMASLATLGIALSFAATAITGILSALTNTPVWKTGLAVVAIILVVSIPSVVLTWFRLRARDLAPILNASGWAVNRRIGLTAGLGRFFTQRAVYIGKRFVPAPVMARTGRATRVWGVIAVLLVVGAAVGGMLWWRLVRTKEALEPSSPEIQAQTVDSAGEGVEKIGVPAAPAEGGK